MGLCRCGSLRVILCNRRATREYDTEHHDATRDNMPMCRKLVRETKDDMIRHNTAHTLGGMESNKDLR